MNKTIKNILSIFVIISIVVSFFIFAKELKNVVVSNQDNKVIEQVVEKYVEENKEGFSKQTFDSLREINEDMVGYISFDSGIIELPVVQGDDNEHYLTTAFSGTSNDQGAIFLDHSVTLNDQNPIIYGHNVLYDSKAKFSPLTKIIEQDYYEKNSSFKLYLENEIRNYKITDAYIFDTRDLGLFNYVKPNFNNGDDFNEWYSTVKELSLIDSLYGNATYDDEMLTLQTCKSLNSTQRIIIMAKLDSVEKY